MNSRYKGMYSVWGLMHYFASPVDLSKAGQDDVGGSTLQGDGPIPGGTTE